MRVAKEFMKKWGLMLLVIAVIIALIVLYVCFVDRPIRKGQELIDTAMESLETEADEVDARLAELQKMQREMDKIESGEEERSYMPSYNSSKAELDFLNQTLSWTEDYYIGFNQASRDGNQIRRGFSLQFKASNFASAISILSDLESGENRCLVGDLSISPVERDGTLQEGSVQVSCTATFYETMVGGTPDAELPEDFSHD